MDTPNRHLLKLARELRGLTQVQLAAQSGIDQGAISRYESGDKLLTEDVIGTLAAALNYPVAFFMRDYEPAPMLQCKRGWVKLDGRRLETGDELSEAIPPAFTEFIGKQLIGILDNLADFARGR